MMPPAQARLLGALLSGNEAIAARDLAALDATGWTDLLRVAGEDLLTPEIAAPLATPALAAFVPPEVARYLADLRARNAERNARIAAQAAELIPAFAAAGLCPLLLKGARAFADPEPERADRVTGDLDLLFRPSELDAAAAALGDLGYLRIAKDAGSHSQGYFVRAGEPAPVDLHHAPLRPSHLLSTEELFARAQCSFAFGVPVWVADAADEVLQRVLHETVHHHAYRHGVASVRSLRGIAVRLPMLDAVGWGKLQARSTGRSLVPVATALRLIEDVFGPGAVAPEGALLARRPIVRIAAWRTWANAASVLSGPVDALWGAAAAGLGAYEYRPGVDGSLTVWRVRGLGRILRRAISAAAPQSRRTNLFRRG